MSCFIYELLFEGIQLGVLYWLAVGVPGRYAVPYFDKYQQISTTDLQQMKNLYKNGPFSKGMFKTKKKPAASLKCRNWGLGLPIHTKIQLISISMPFISISMK